MIWALIAVALLLVSNIIFVILWFRMGEEWYDQKCRADSLQLELDRR